MKDKCKNCGGDLGIHHYQTNQCPVGGREAPFGHKQEYKTTTYQEDDYDLRAEVIELRKELGELQTRYEIVINKLATLYEKEHA